MIISTPIRVLIVDDQRLVREGLHMLLDMEPQIEVVGEAGDGAEAERLYAGLLPDVVLMDVRMPNVDGVAATRQLCTRWPDARILILTTFDDDALVIEGLRAGARGYMLKDASGAELARAVQTVAAGGSLMGPGVASKVLDRFARLADGPGPLPEPLLEPLSEREHEILRLLARGLSNPEIAAQLHLAEGTVKNYVSSILQKTGSRDRTQAALRAQALGLL